MPLSLLISGHASFQTLTIVAAIVAAGDNTGLHEVCILGLAIAEIELAEIEPWTTSE